jgi:hypothetical protein
LDKPTLVILDLDTMVMDNHEARKRHGVAPSYKGVKGFQPLQLVWGRVVIDAVLRGGDHHGNGGDTAARMVTRAVDKIRARYSPSVAIIIRHDAGFFDQHLFELYEEKLEIGYISGGRLFDQTKEYVQRCSPEAWQVFVNGTRSGALSSSAIGGASGRGFGEPSSAGPSMRTGKFSWSLLGQRRSSTPTSGWARRSMSSSVRQDMTACSRPTVLSSATTTVVRTSSCTGR